MIKRIKWILWDCGKGLPPPTSGEANSFAVGIIIGSAITAGGVWVLTFKVGWL